MIGEAVVLATLLGSSLKFEGRFILQTHTDGPVDMLVVDFVTPDKIRAYARFDREAVEAAVLANAASPAALLGKGHLAMTIDQGLSVNRYQGVVALTGEGLEEAAPRIFPPVRADPDRVRLAWARNCRRAAARPGGRAGCSRSSCRPRPAARRRRTSIRAMRRRAPNSSGG